MCFLKRHLMPKHRDAASLHVQAGQNKLSNKYLYILIHAKTEKVILQLLSVLCTQRFAYLQQPSIASDCQVCTADSKAVLAHSLAFDAALPFIAGQVSTAAISCSDACLKLVETSGGEF